MEYEIVRGPFMLREVVGMLYKFTNGASYRSVLRRHKFLGGATITEAMTRRMECLQQIMREVCGDLDPQDPQLQRFFASERIDGENTCIARMLTSAPFVVVENMGIREHGDRICAIWDALQARNVWITDKTSAGLSFSREPGCTKDIFDQIGEIHSSLEYQVKLYRALRDFPKTMDTLVALAEPLAERLEKCLLRESWLMDEAEEYWRKVFETTPPLDFLRHSSMSSSAVKGASEKTKIAICYMGSNWISYSMAGDAYIPRDHNILIIGSAATSTAIANTKLSDTETIGAMLKALGDKRRLDILRRLNKERSYCHELAETMGIDPGNMSRNLALLHSFGFLQQEKELPIYYYQTDREAIRSFLQLVESVILD